MFSTFSRVDFLSVDIFSKWQIEFERNHTFDPEDETVPWKMLEHTKNYAEDDWEETDFEPYRETFVQAHASSVECDLEVSASLYAKVSRDANLSLPYYKIQNVTLKKKETLQWLFVEAIHHLFERFERNLSGDGLVSHFVQKPQFSDFSDDPILLAEMRFLRPRRLVVKLSLLEDETDYYAHGLRLPKNFLKNWTAEYEEIKTALPVLRAEPPNQGEIDTHEEVAKRLSAWLRRNVHEIPVPNTKLFASDMGFLSQIIEQASVRGFEKTPQDMYNWLKLLKMYGRCAIVDDRVASPLDFRVATNFRVSVKRKRHETFGPFNFESEEVFKAFRDAVTLLADDEVAEDLANQINVEPLDFEEESLRSGLRFLHATVEKVENKNGTLSFTLKDGPFFDLLCNHRADEKAKEEMLCLFEYLDHVGVTFRCCAEKIPKARVEEWQRESRFILKEGLLSGIETWKDLASAFARDRLTICE